MYYSQLLYTAKTGSVMHAVFLYSCYQPDASIEIICYVFVDGNTFAVGAYYRLHRTNSGCVKRL